MTKLLIVESPGKIKTLRKILGKGWDLEASFGHTTELAQDGPKRLGFEIKGSRHIETHYIPRGTRGKQVLTKLRSAVKRADEVYLATDPDREGEAIAWHLVDQLKLRKYVRISYTQITEAAVKAAVKNPRRLDLSLVQAQRARQCLDKWVGYEVSPLLWNSTGGRSAGRVQSATLHLVCERERERLAFKSENYWTLRSVYQEGLKARYEPSPLRASPLHEKPSDQSEASLGRVSTEEEAKRIEKIAKTSSHAVKSLFHREEGRSPPPPLITSSLQQAAGMRFRYSPKKTMAIAQELYEGIDGKGLITYMRTDAVVLSPEFVAEARSWLKERAPSALAEKAHSFKIDANSQGAHEAIRPTSVEMTPEHLKNRLNHDQFNIYALIWERAIASQCKPALLSRTQVEILAGGTRWVSRGMRVLDPGYLQFWKNIQDECELPNLFEGQVLRVQEIQVEKKSTEPPSRYSEPKLVQLMEKLGIGRPSTYASTIDTLKERDYVILEKGTLAPTRLGLGTDEALGKAMPELINARFTAQMEERLDDIARGKLSWEPFLCDWNESYFKPALIKAQIALVGVARVVNSTKSLRAKPKSRKFKRARKRTGYRAHE